NGKGMFVLQEGTPEFDEKKHCDYKFCEPGKTLVDIEYGIAVGET
ncbi:unnamed protein product, partial [marine sediment metagenome]